MALAGAGRQPNILLITTDQQRCDTLACYGNRYALSPHLDQLAAEGVVFEQAHTSSPVYLPARSSLLTGVHAPIHGAIENGIARRDHLTTYPHLLAGAAYHTILVGKAHFGPMPDGFAVRCVVGEKSARREDPWSAHLREHGLTHPTGFPHTIPPELFMEAFLVERTIGAIAAAVALGGAPFFAHCSLVSPHEPHDPPGRWAEIFRDRPLPPLNYREGEIERHPAHLHELLGVGRRADLPDHFLAGRPDMAAIDAERRLYYGLAAYCDEQIGRLLRFLYYFEEARGRLFDRRDDPREQENLYNSTAHRAVRDELLTALLAWRGDLTGLDAERRLGDRLVSLDARTA